MKKEERKQAGQVIEELYQERLKRKKEAKAQGKEAYRAYCESEKKAKKKSKP